MNLALFDFDNTISLADTWTPFIRTVVPRARLLSGTVAVSPVVLRYKLGLTSASTARQAIVKVGLKGVDASHVRRLGAHYAATTIPGVLRPSALERVEWHRSQGDHVVVVSGSLDVYLRPWCDTRGLACISTSLEEESGLLTGDYAEGDCVGVEKARRILARYDLSAFPVVYAYGDSVEDREMLALAHRRFYRWTELGSDAAAL